MVEEYTWQVVVLIPKGGVYNRDIVLVEIVWKVVAVILNFRLIASIAFHKVLHGFQVVHGTGTATLDAKLLQQLASMMEDIMYVIFLELHKVYDALDRYRCL